MKRIFPTKYNCNLLECYWWYVPHAHLDSPKPVEPTIPRHVFPTKEEYLTYLESCKKEKLVWYPESVAS